MKFWFEDAFHIDTTRSVEEIVDSFGKKVEPSKLSILSSNLFENLFHKAEYRGFVTKDGFKVQRNTGLANPAQPVITGRFLPRPSGVRIAIRLGLAPAAAVCIMAFLVGFGGWILTDLVALITGEASPNPMMWIPVVFLGFAWLLNSVGFWPEARKDRRRLPQLLGGQGASEPSPAPRGMVSRWIWFLLVVLGMIFTSRSCHEILYQGVTPGPDFIEELRSGTVSRKNVIGVHILDYAGTGIWPFVEEDYRQLERVSIRPESAVEELLDLLERHSTKGHKYRNHPPGPDRIGVLRFETSDGGVYYLYYKLTYYQRAWHVGVSANSRGSTNPNGAQPYENIPLAEFLWKHDTFWQREKKGGRFPSTPPPGSE